MTHPSVDLLHDVANLTNLTNSTNSSSTTVGPPGSEGVRQLEGHRAAVLAVAFSPDGSRLVTGSVDGTLRVFLPRRDPGGGTRPITECRSVTTRGPGGAA